MATIKVCDKCKKEIKDKDGGWNIFDLYNYKPRMEKRHPLKINKQMVNVRIKIDLACGENLDLCNKCADKIIKYYTADK